MPFLILFTMLMVCSSVITSLLPYPLQLAVNILVTTNPAASIHLNTLYKLYAGFRAQSRLNMLIYKDLLLTVVKKFLAPFKQTPLAVLTKSLFDDITELESFVGIASKMELKCPISCSLGEFIDYYMSILNYLGQQQFLSVIPLTRRLDLSILTMKIVKDSLLIMNEFNGHFYKIASMIAMYCESVSATFVESFFRIQCTAKVKEPNKYYKLAATPSGCVKIPFTVSKITTLVLDKLEYPVNTMQFFEMASLQYDSEWRFAAKCFEEADAIHCTKDVHAFKSICRCAYNVVPEVIPKSIQRLKEFGAFSLFNTNQLYIELLDDYTVFSKAISFTLTGTLVCS